MAPTWYRRQAGCWGIAVTRQAWSLPSWSHGLAGEQEADRSAVPGEESGLGALNSPDTDGRGPDAREDLVFASVYHLP